MGGKAQARGAPAGATRRRAGGARHDTHMSGKDEVDAVLEQQRLQAPKRAVEEPVAQRRGLGNALAVVEHLRAVERTVRVEHDPGRHRAVNGRQRRVKPQPLRLGQVPNERVHPRVGINGEIRRATNRP